MTKASRAKAPTAAPETVAAAPPPRKRTRSTPIAGRQVAMNTAPSIEPIADIPSLPKGKLGQLIEMLQRPDGATIAALREATGWQAHSIRGAISGAVKKKLGLSVTAEKTEAGRVYRITKEVGA